MKTPTLSDIYDEFAATYDENRGLFDMTEILDSFFARLPMKPGRLLDLGCGAGEPFARFFVDHGWDVTGVDFSHQILHFATKYVPEMTTMYADMRDVSFDPARFDAITAIYSLFHVPRIDHPSLFEKFHAWLRPEGKALFTYATREYTGSDEFDGYKEFLGKQLYYSHSTPDKLYEQLEDAGFIIDAADYRDIGGEVFLWVTVSKPASGKETFLDDSGENRS